MSFDVYKPGDEDRPCPGCDQKVTGTKHVARGCSRGKRGGMVARPVEVWVVEEHRAPCGLPCDGEGLSQKGVHRSEGCAACRSGRRIGLVTP